MEIENIKYTYRTINEIHSLLSASFQSNTLQIVLMIIMIIVCIGFILYIVPGFMLLKKQWRIERDKLSKKLVLKQILIQKEIETEIENEIKMKQETKFQKQKHV